MTFSIITSGFYGEFMNLVVQKLVTLQTILSVPTTQMSGPMVWRRCANNQSISGEGGNKSLRGILGQ